MACREEITQIALSRGWQLIEHAERTGSLGAVDEWHRENNVVRVFFGARGAVRTGWIREGNRDWWRINGQDKCAKVKSYLKTGYQR
jgi:hypothetical protein